MPSFYLNGQAHDRDVVSCAVCVSKGRAAYICPCGGVIHYDCVPDGYASRCDGCGVEGKEDVSTESRLPSLGRLTPDCPNGRDGDDSDGPIPADNERGGSLSSEA
jgi:hypothetical protein